MPGNVRCPAATVGAGAGGVPLEHVRVAHVQGVGRNRPMLGSGPGGDSGSGPCGAAADAGTGIAWQERPAGFVRKARSGGE